MEYPEIDVITSRPGGVTTNMVSNLEGIWYTSPFHNVIGVLNSLGHKSET